MPQSLAQVYVHVVFSTKHREAFLTDPELRQKLHAYLAGIGRQLETPAIIVGGVEDHVHLLCRLGRTVAIANFVRDLKKASSVWVKEQAAALATFGWQSGYGAFSVSPAHVKPLTRYIRDQSEHHRRESFQDELRRLCRKYGVQFDERYVWD